MEEERTYLGDSVYASWEGDMIKLFTWNGYPDDPRNVVYMEPAVFEALLQFGLKPELYTKMKGE